MVSPQTWMHDLAGHIGGRRLREVAIPGSHHSGAYNLTNAKTVGFGRAWADAQSLTIKQQLEAGVRYLDLRLMYYAGVLGLQEGVYVAHTSDGGVLTYWGEKVEAIVQAVRDFQDAHEREIVILDFNHFYAMNAAQHDRLAKLLRAAFGDLAAPPGESDLTIEEMWSRGRRVVLLYGGDQQGSGGQDRALAIFPALWGQDKIYATWANATDFQTLYDRVDNALKLRDRSRLYNVFGTFTPDGAMIAKSYLPFVSGFASLESAAKVVGPQFMGWLRWVWSGRAINIVSLDYFQNTNLVETMIALNRGESVAPPRGASLHGDESFGLPTQDGRPARANALL